MPRLVMTGLVALGLVAAALQTARAQEQTLDRSVDTQNRIVKHAAATQAKIDRLSAQTQKLLNEYLAAKQQTDQLQDYNANLQGLVNDQKARIASLNEQVGHVGEVEHGIVPLMNRMIAGLKDFIRLDMPFHRDERLQSAQKLQALMTNSDVTISEKYRQIMAAYQNELDYGRTLGAYRGPVTIDGKQRTVQFLRVGRISLCYQTLNESRTACWNKAKDQWIVNDGYRRNVANGLAIARKHSSPDLITLPVLAPQQPLENTSLPPLRVAPAMQTSPAANTQAAPTPQTAPASQSHS